MGQDAPSDDPSRSSLRLEISLAIGYQRRRTTLGGAWEGHLVTAGLLLFGALVVLIFVWRIMDLRIVFP